MEYNKESWNPDIVGFICTKKVLNPDHLKRIFKKYWGIISEIRFLIFAKSYIGGQLKDKLLIEGLLSSGPWIYMGKIIGFQNFFPGKLLEYYDKQNFKVWTNVYVENPPILSIMDKVERVSLVGKVIQVDCQNYESKKWEISLCPG